MNEQIIFRIVYYHLMSRHFVYILLTEKNTLYCGYTTDLKRRFEAHLSGKGAKYTKAFKPVKIVYSKEFSTKSEALKHEYCIKHKFTHDEKLELIRHL